MTEPAAEPGQAGLPSREQAENHYDEAVAEAVQACAEDTAGQRCYICMENRIISEAKVAAHRQPPRRRSHHESQALIPCGSRGLRL